MAPRLWLLLLLVAGGLLQARAQSDNKGFISIDCGLQGEESYIDEETNLVYVSDAGFTDAGTNYNISAEYVGPRLSKNVHSLRSFPDGERNCYTLQPLVSGHKYLIRATFLYGNYDGLNRRPATFDLYIGVNFWTAVNMSSRVSKDQGDTMMVEALIVVLDDVVQVCLVNTGGGTPFISGLEVRPVKMSLYPHVTAALGLLLLGRVNTGPIDQTIIRYPDDPYDRLWYPWFDPTNYAEMSTTESLTANTKDLFEAPMAVMQTAITPQNASGNLEIYWAAETQPNYPTPGYIAIFHFAELQVLDSSNAELRQFNIYLNDYPDPWHAGYTPDYLYMNFIYSKAASRESSYNFSIEATADSTLPPILNAFEVFSVIPTTNLGTDFQDASAAMTIKDKYKVQKNWMGARAFPKL
uniref:Malectin-like domain-containing protein n=1 Tax=Hordeum vulgare subsp. vulgare TaxID=112509 RepID=A0A8I6WGN4_HORVV